MFVTAALAAFQIAAAQPADTGAFADARAAALVALARQARATQQATLTGYSALAQERASVMVRTAGRDRLVYRRELAARLDWQRAGAATVTLLGAREYVPLPGVGVRVLPDAAAEAPDVAFRPDEMASTIGLGSFRFGPHPLNPGAEADYTYRAGSTSTLVLQQGGTLVMHEIVVVPRRAAPELVSGSIWVEEGTGRVVQEGYRRAADIAAGSYPLIGGVRVELREIFIEHGLWELRWWLPRVVAVEGFVRAGRVATVPFRYERLYSDYTVQGDVGAVVPPDAVFEPVPAAPPARWQVTLPADRSALLDSEFLPASIFDEAAAPLAADVLVPLRTRLDAFAVPRLPLAGGRAFVELAPLDRVRFNRVEGLSFDFRAGVEFGGVQSFADARIATAGRVLRGQLGVAAVTTVGDIGLTGYDRVHAADPTARPFAAGNSLSTFLLGADYGEYYSARGMELDRTSRPAARSPWLLRLYTEQQDSVPARDPFTLAVIFGSGRQWIRAGIATEPATQHGLVFELATGGGVGPGAAHWRVSPRVEAATGDFDFGRASLIANASTPLFTRGIGPLRDGLSVGGEMAVGGSAGTVPGQALWYLGGPATVRGYPAASAAGDGYWRARGELGTTFPVLRAVLFGDVAQSWGRGGFEGHGHPRLAAAGVGMSFLEGLVRVDLARALVFRPGWRLHIAVDNVL